MRFIVTGTPRSGTRYMAVLFGLLDVPCTHEEVFKPQSPVVDGLRWYAANKGGDSSWLAWAFLGVLPSPVAIFHIRRNPWRVIDSIAHRNFVVMPKTAVTDHQQIIQDTIRAYCPRVFEYDSVIDRAAAMLIDWNKCIERAMRKELGYLCCSVDRLEVAQIQTMLRLIGVDRPDAHVARVLDETPKSVNQGRCVKHDVRISNPGVERFLRERFPNSRLRTQRVMPAEDSKTPEELAELMAPSLVWEVNDYAERHGYPTVGATAVA